MTTVINLSRSRGDSYADQLAITSETSGAAVDITGYSFLLTVDSRQAPTDSTTQMFQVTGSITSAATGMVEFAPTAEQTDIPPAKYYYDIQLTDGSGRKRTIAKGKYTIIQDITKD